eukprot:EG_transcript_11604
MHTDLPPGAIHVYLTWCRHRQAVLVRPSGLSCTEKVRDWLATLHNASEHFEIAGVKDLATGHVTWASPLPGGYGPGVPQRQLRPGAEYELILRTPATEASRLAFSTSAAPSYAPAVHACPPWHGRPPHLAAPASAPSSARQYWEPVPPSEGSGEDSGLSEEEEEEGQGRVYRVAHPFLAEQPRQGSRGSQVPSSAYPDALQPGPAYPRQYSTDGDGDSYYSEEEAHTAPHNFIPRPRQRAPRPPRPPAPAAAPAPIGVAPCHKFRVQQQQQMQLEGMLEPEHAEEEAEVAWRGPRLTEEEKAAAHARLYQQAGEHREKRKRLQAQKEQEEALSPAKKLSPEELKAVQERLIKPKKAPPPEQSSPSKALPPSEVNRLLHRLAKPKARSAEPPPPAAAAQAPRPKIPREQHERLLERLAKPAPRQVEWLKTHPPKGSQAAAQLAAESGAGDAAAGPASPTPAAGHSW